jgi:hemerythrin-like domain-containing protein
MLVQLNGHTRPNEDAVALLADCHERIRRFSAMALKLAVSTNEDPAVLQDAAARVHRYFTVALPLHVEDEELTVLPRLQPKGSEAVVSALRKMHDEHERIEALLTELVPVWDELQRDPSRLPTHQEWLSWASRSFQCLMEEHLVREETVLFPAMRRQLSPEDLEAIRTEMQARRKTPSV